METQASFKQYTRAVRKRWWLLALLAIIAMTGVYVRFGDAPPSYVATATVMVTSSPITPVVSPLGGESARTAGSSTLQNDLVEVLQTRSVAQRVARRLSQENVAGVQGSISALTSRTNSLLRIQGTAADPQTAAATANAAAEELGNYFRETNSQDAREARLFIDQQLVQVRRQLDASDRAIQVVRQNLVDVEGAAGAIVSSYYGALTMLDDARRTLQETEARLASAGTRLSREQATLVSETAILENPVYRQIQSRLVDLEVERTQLAPVYTPAHPRMRQLEGQIAALRSRLSTESATQIGREVRTSNPTHARLVQDVLTLQVERAAVQARIASLQQTVSSRRSAVATMPAGQLRVARLVRENQILEANYRLLATQYQEAVLRENVARFFPAGLQVIEAAVAPERPRPSGIPRTAAAAAAAGIVLGIIAALFLEATDEAIKTPEDVERTLGVPVLAEIPNANEPRVTPANAMFMAGFIILFGLGLLGAYVHTPLPPVNVAGRVMRATVIAPLESGVAQVRVWVNSVAQSRAQTAIGAGQ